MRKPETFRIFIFAKYLYCLIVSEARTDTVSSAKSYIKDSKTQKLYSIYFSMSFIPISYIYCNYLIFQSFYSISSMPKMKDESDEEMYFMRKESERHNQTIQKIEERQKTLDLKTRYYFFLKSKIIDTRTIVTFLGRISNNQELYESYINYILKNNNFGEFIISTNDFQNLFN